MRAALVLLAALASSYAPALAAETSFQLGLAIKGNAEFKTVTYDCEGIPSFDVEYINAAPNFLAVIPVQAVTYVFTAVTAASGVKYVAGNFVWWTKGTDAEWYDVTQGDDAPPAFKCSEHIQTP
jgi:membrane-bound inhibitor of C-type lysozyme